jgi:predicted O-linked N-acetylglucosamine transferase (SPINDLY family)
MTKSRAIDLSQAAFQAFQHRNYVEARTKLRKALKLETRNPRLWSLSGHTHVQLGDLPSAIKAFRKAANLDPANADDLNNLSLAYFNSERFEDAARAGEEALKRNSKHVKALVNLANAYVTLERYDDAIPLFEQALSMEPGYVKARVNYSAALLKAQRPEDAFEALGDLVNRTDHVGAQKAAGHALASQRRHEEAIEYYKNALRVEPDNASVYGAIAIAFRETAKYKDAIEAAEFAVKYGGEKPNYLMPLVDSLSKSQRFTEAREKLERIGEADRGAEFYNRSGGLYTDIGEPGLAVEEYLKSTRVDEGMLLGGYSNAALTALYRYETIEEKYDDVIARFDECTKDFKRYEHDNAPVTKPVRVGLISGDFRLHSVSFFLRGWLGEIDRNDIELVAFATESTKDRVTEELRAHFTDWFDLHEEREMLKRAEIIHEAGLDLVVDLSGHTSGTELGTLSTKPAPRQASWLGFSASTGVKEMDYWLVDDHVSRPTEKSVEQKVSLGPSYLCYKPLETAPVEPEQAREDDAFWFACFNNIAKLSPQSLDVWVDILEACPNAKLRLQSRLFQDAVQAEAWKERFVQRGLDPDRLKLVSWVASREDFLRMYHHVDVALDPFPYNGTTTSFEAIYMGVPMITLVGDRMVSRVGHMINANLGLDQFNADSIENYKDIAIRAYNREEGYALERTEIRRRLEESPLMDGKDFARRFTQAVFQMTGVK